jgi:hypothetical protein
MDDFIRAATAGATAIVGKGELHPSVEAVISKF